MLQTESAQPTIVFNLVVLAISQALGLSAASMMVLAGGIVGRDLAPRPELATLPIALTIVGLALATVPGAMLSRRFGRRAAFVIGALVASGAALLLALAVKQASFALFCLGAFVLGLNTAFVQQYRFAAAESAAPQFAGRAIAWVLVGGIGGGFLGPTVAPRGRDLLAVPYAGSFLVLAAILLLSALIVSRLRPVADRVVEKPASGSAPAPPTRLADGFLVGVLGAAVAYAVMSLVMTATPLHLSTNGFEIEQVALIIQSHTVAMYLPSLMTGYIMDRLGIVRVILAGSVGMAASVVLGVVGTTFLHFWGALILLGLGWNLMFVGGTVLLARSAAGERRFRLQAINDFTIFAAQAVASLSAGTALVVVGWDVLNLAALPLLAAVAVIVLLRRRSFPPRPHPASLAA